MRSTKKKVIILGGNEENRQLEAKEHKGDEKQGNDQNFSSPTQPTSSETMKTNSNIFTKAKEKGEVIKEKIEDGIHKIMEITDKFAEKLPKYDETNSNNTENVNDMYKTGRKEGQREQRDEHLSKTNQQYRMSGDAQESYSQLNDEFTLKHPLWSEQEVQKVDPMKHKPVKGVRDIIAYSLIKIMKFEANLFSGFYFGHRTPAKWLNHIIFLETIAGVPGTAGALVRHLTSLGLLRKDNGWIHSMIEEAENERVHLLTALEMKKPSLWIRMLILMSQTAFFSLFSFFYIISPKFSHRFVGYMEEESIKSYTLLLKDMDDETNPIHKWGNSPAPQLAKSYWNLGENATVRDTILAIRADEAHHRDVNHTFSDMRTKAANPFPVA